MRYFILSLFILTTGCSKKEKIETTKQEPPSQKKVAEEPVKKETPPNKNYLLQKVYTFYTKTFIKANHLKMFNSSAIRGIAYADGQNEPYTIDISVKRHLDNFKAGKKEIDILFKEFEKPGPAQKETYKFIANFYSELNEYEKFFVVENMQDAAKFKKMQQERMLSFEKAKTDLHEHYKKLLKLKTDTNKEPLLPAL